MLLDTGNVLLHQELEELDTQVDLALGTMVEAEEVEGVNEVRHTVDCLVELVLGEYASKHSRKEQQISHRR